MSKKCEFMTKTLADNFERKQLKIQKWHTEISWMSKLQLDKNFNMSRWLTSLQTKHACN